MTIDKETLSDVANKDTPEAVNIPNTWAGIIAWMTIRFGIGTLAAVVFGMATKEVYRDMRSDRQELLKSYNENSLAMKDMANEMQKQTDAITRQMQQQTDAIRTSSDSMKDAIRALDRNSK